MDRNSAREMFLTRFRPKEKDIPTPYLGDLDGHLKLVGISGKQSIEMEQAATYEEKRADGTSISKLNAAKFTAMAIYTCLRLRETGEHLLNETDVDTFLDELDNEFSKPLIKEVMDLIGKKDVTLEEKKRASGNNQNDSNITSSPQGSEEPSMNSSTESTPPS